MMDHLEELLRRLVSRKEDQVLLYDSVHSRQEDCSLRWMLFSYFDLISISDIDGPSCIGHYEDMPPMTKEFGHIWRLILMSFIKRVRNEYPSFRFHLCLIHCNYDQYELNNQGRYRRQALFDRLPLWCRSKEKWYPLGPRIWSRLFEKIFPFGWGYEKRGTLKGSN